MKQKETDGKFATESSTCHLITWSITKMWGNLMYNKLMVGENERK